MINSILHKTVAVILVCIATTVLEVSAKDFEIDLFEIDNFDTTANAPGTTEYDPNGDKCALIKVQTTLRNIRFDAGYNYVKPVAQNSEHPAEIWLYVSPGTRRISLQHAEAGSITDYDLGMRLESGRTYRMGLTNVEVNMVSADYDNPVNLTIHTIPGGATVAINGVPLVTDRNGFANMKMAGGRHTFRASAPMHHTLDGRMELNNPEESLYIELAKAYGWVAVPLTDDYLKGATVLIDSNEVGTVPLSDFAVPSGRHTVTVRQNLYEDWKTNIEMRDTLPLTLTPHLTPDFGMVLLHLPSVPDLVLQLDGKKVDFDSGRKKTEFNRPVNSGDHVFTISRPNHYPYEIHFTLPRDGSVELTAREPEPITGAMQLFTSPAGAEVWIDGEKQQGVTPLSVNDIIIGDHKVEYKRKGCRPETLTVTVTENGNTQSNTSLRDYFTINVLTNPAGAALYLNGMSKGITPVEISGDAGNYELKFIKDKYVTKKKTYTLDGNSPGIMEVKLQRNLVPSWEFYFLADYRFISTSMMDVGLGFYAENVNFEISYTLGFSKETFYENSSESSSFNMKPQGLNIKAGYGISIPGRFRITPRLGFTYLNFAADSVSYEYMDFDSVNSFSIEIGANCGFSLCRGVRIFAEPYYAFAVGKNDAMKMLSNASEIITNYAEGFHLSAGIQFFF